MSTKFRSLRPLETEFAPYYASYVAKVPDSDVIQSLERARADTVALIGTLTEQQANFRYAPEKWSVREILGHIADCERVFAYRALRVARNDTTPLASFEHDIYVKESGIEARPLSSIAAEYEHIRLASIDLLSSLTETAWLRRGVASGNEISVRALAWIIAGHEIHHKKVIREKYL